MDQLLVQCMNVSKQLKPSLFETVYDLFPLLICCDQVNMLRLSNRKVSYVRSFLSCLVVYPAIYLSHHLLAFQRIQRDGSANLRIAIARSADVKAMASGIRAKQLRTASVCPFLTLAAKNLSRSP
jgi:hypothetical protein